MIWVTVLDPADGALIEFEMSNHAPYWSVRREVERRWRTDPNYELWAGHERYDCPFHGSPLHRLGPWARLMYRIGTPSVR